MRCCASSCQMVLGQRFCWTRAFVARFLDIFFSPTSFACHRQSRKGVSQRSQVPSLCTGRRHARVRFPVDAAQSSAACLGINSELRPSASALLLDFHLRVAVENESGAHPSAPLTRSWGGGTTLPTENWPAHGRLPSRQWRRCALGAQSHSHDSEGLQKPRNKALWSAGGAHPGFQQLLSRRALQQRSLVPGSPFRDHRQPGQRVFRLRAIL